MNAGMFASDRCKFCHDFWDKEKPYICPDCWQSIKEVIKEYKNELCPEIKKLEASNKKFRSAIEKHRESASVENVTENGIEYFYDDTELYKALEE
jgi:predicted amidophosphoribosyltransferase